METDISIFLDHLIDRTLVNLEEDDDFSFNDFIQFVQSKKYLNSISSLDDEDYEEDENNSRKSDGVTSSLVKERKIKRNFINHRDSVALELLMKETEDYNIRNEEMKQINNFHQNDNDDGEILNEENSENLLDGEKCERRNEIKTKKSVKFPIGDNLRHFSKSEIVNPWTGVEGLNWPDRVMEATDQYVMSCRRHSIGESHDIMKLLSDLRSFTPENEKAPLLILKGDLLGMSHVYALEEVFSRIPFYSVEIRGVIQDSFAFSVLCDMFEYYTSIEKLNFHHCFLNSNESWRTFSRHVHKIHSLNTLQFYRVDVENSMAGEMFHYLNMSPTITKIHFDRVNMHQRHIGFLATALRYNKLIRELYLTHASLQASDGDHLSVMLRDNRSLLLLDLSHNSLDDAGITKLCDGLSKQHSKGPTSTQLNSLTKAPFITLHQLFTESLHSYCSGDEDYRMNLPKIVLSNDLDYQVSSVVCANSECSKKDIDSYYCGLKTLIVTSNNIKSNGIQAISRAMYTNNCLTSLYLDGNNVGNDGVYKLREAFYETRQIQCLSLQSCRIGDQGAIALAEFITETPLLKKLDLRENDIRSSGLLALYHSIKFSKTLYNFYVDLTNRRDNALKKDRELIHSLNRIKGEVDDMLNRNKANETKRYAKRKMEFDDLMESQKSMSENGKLERQNKENNMKNCDESNVNNNDDAVNNLSGKLKEAIIEDHLEKKNFEMETRTNISTSNIPTSNPIRIFSSTESNNNNQINDSHGPSSVESGSCGSYDYCDDATIRMMQGLKNMNIIDETN
ncbi:hypothetical protein SNEBB_002767 [Seison nebaliae]|nr:hypothetical protein SNEBB_002767 [Seison nebaliae]